MENKAKLITVYPMVSGNGAKFVGTNIAHFLKVAHPTKKIALVDFNMKQPYLAHALTTHDEIHGIDNLIDKIDGNHLTDELFIENMVMLKNNVEVLKGTKMIGKHKVFTEKHMKAFVEHLKSIYDYVIAVVSTDVDNAGTVYGIHEADTVIMVGRNNVANAKSAYRALGVVSQYKKSSEPIKMVYNMHTSGSSDLAEFVKDTELEVIGLVEYDDGAIDNLDLNGNQGVKFFKAKSKNQDAFTNMVKNL
jgi:MinD-like ATPase involved in chromosome partitioning or flagellar assembly